MIHVEPFDRQRVLICLDGRLRQCAERSGVQEAQHRVRQCDGLRQHRRGESQVSLWCNSAPPNSVGWISALPTPQQTKLGRMADG